MDSCLHTNGTSLVPNRFDKNKKICYLVYRDITLTQKIAFDQNNTQFAISYLHQPPDKEPSFFQ